MRGFTKFDNELLEKILTSDFRKRQLKILLLVIRFSAGFQKRSAVLRSADFAYAGVSASCIGDELDQLSKMRVLYRDEQRGTVWLNPFFGQWTVRAVAGDHSRVFRIAASNFPNRQGEHRRIDGRTSPETNARKETKERKESFFRQILQEYVQRVGLLDRNETALLRDCLANSGSLAVRRAIDAVAADGSRSFGGFLQRLGRRTP